MSSFPNSSLINAASGIPLIATPTIESASICRFSSSSRAMSDIAAAMKPMRFPYTPTDRQPIFTSFGASPPLIPRVKSQVTVSGDRCNSSAISFSERPFSLYSMALFAIEFTSFIGSPTPLRTMRDAGYQDIGLVRGLCRNRRGVRLQPDLLQAAQFLDLVVEDFPHVLHRQRAGVEDRIVEELVRIRFPESLLHVVAQLDDEILADQVRQLVRRIVRVPFHLCDRAGALHPRLPHQEVDRLVEGHLARVQVDVDQDSAGPPDLVEELHELRLRVGAESGLLHHVLAVMGPALDRLRRIRQDAGVRWIQARVRELQVMSGISLMDRRVPYARVRMLAQHLGLVLDRRHHVESLFVRLEARRRVVRRERDHVPQVRRRLDDGEFLVRRDRREVVLADERLRVRHRLRRVRERLLEARGMVGLHDLLRFLDRCAGLDFIRDAPERSLAFAQIFLADGEDLLHRQTELTEPDEFSELRRADAHLVLRLRQHIGPDPLRVVLERGTRFRNGLFEASAVWTGQGLLARRLDYVKEAGDALRRLERNLAPDLDRGSNPPLGLLQEAGRPFESSGDALESPRQRSEGTHVRAGT